MRSKWSANSSLDVGGRGGSRHAVTWNRGVFGLLFPGASVTRCPLRADVASILIPLLLLLTVLLVAGLVFWYKWRIRG